MAQGARHLLATCLGGRPLTTVTTANVQLHGYRKGHQLLGSTVELSRDDQATIDRMSDAAGPLRPREEFKSYLSAYPLPSGKFYVVARTWQDLTVPRAGCVRTKSVLIDVEIWSQQPPLSAILKLLDPAALPDHTGVVPVVLDEDSYDLLPRGPKFGANDLVEALFLEDAKPVAVFDAPDPELIAIRLLKALWPDLRRRFALSTFALSPRKIGDRDFDLVFVPLNAKSRFADWPGRRVDGRESKTDRHRWTGAIARRIFEAPIPSLLSDRDLDLLGEHDADSPAALRIALLWAELLDKSNKMPAAVLGLLDIANSGMVNQHSALELLEPRLVEATRMAADVLPPDDAWEFVSALVRKMQGHNLPRGRLALNQLACFLATDEPGGAIKLMRQPDPQAAIDQLVTSLAIGIAQAKATLVEEALGDASADIVARLVSRDATLARRVATEKALAKKMVSVLTQAETEHADGAAAKMVPYLTDDWQMPLASLVFSRFDSDDVVESLTRLQHANNTSSVELGTALLARARKLKILAIARNVIVSNGEWAQRDALLGHAIDPSEADLLWVLDEPRLSKRLVSVLVSDLLRRATDKQLAKMLGGPRLTERVMGHLPDNSLSLITRALNHDSLAITTYASIIRAAMPRLDSIHQVDMAKQVLSRCLTQRFDGDEVDLLSMLLNTIGQQLDAQWAVRIGLERDVEAETASRNLSAFAQTVGAAHKRILSAVSELARTLQGRQGFDFPEWGNETCAKLFFEAEHTDQTALVDAAGWLVPSLLRARRQPVSLMIAALFPMLYKELVQKDDVPELFKFVPFLDWDRSKIARRDLVDAFLSSDWQPGDLALTACRCDDIDRILNQVARSFRGGEYLDSIEQDLKRLQAADRLAIQRALSDVRSKHP